MSTKEIIGAHLREDLRVRGKMIAKKQIFTSPIYKIDICIFAAIKKELKFQNELVTASVYFKEEDLRIIYKLGSDEIKGDPMDHIKTVVAQMEQRGVGPLHLVRDAKQYCNLPFTKSDETALLTAGITI